MNWEQFGYSLLLLFALLVFFRNWGIVVLFAIFIAVGFLINHYMNLGMSNPVHIWLFGMVVTTIPIVGLFGGNALAAFTRAVGEFFGRLY